MIFHDSYAWFKMPTLNAFNLASIFELKKNKTFVYSLKLKITAVIMRLRT